MRRIDNIKLSDYLFDQKEKSFYGGYVDRLNLAVEFMNTCNDICEDAGLARANNSIKAKKQKEEIPFWNIDNIYLEPHGYVEYSLIPIYSYEMTFQISFEPKKDFNNFAFADKELFYTKSKRFFGPAKQSTNIDIQKRKSENIVSTISKILFNILFCCHPFCGIEYFSAMERTEDEERKFFYNEKSFIFDLKDNANRFINGYHNKAWNIWMCLTEQQRTFWKRVFEERLSFGIFYSLWKNAYDNFCPTYSQTLCGKKIPTIVYSKDKYYIILSDNVVATSRFYCEGCIAFADKKCENCHYKDRKPLVDFFTKKVKFKSKSKDQDLNEIVTEKELIIFNGMSICESMFPNGKSSDRIFTVIASTKHYGLLGLKLKADRTISVLDGSGKREYSFDAIIPLLPGTKICISKNLEIIVPDKNVDKGEFV